MTVDILGVTYEYITKKYDDDPIFKEDEVNGYVEFYEKRIVICDTKTHPLFYKSDDISRSVLERETLRHEIVHAFLYESGLDSSALNYEGPWSRNEEMIDWLAIQGPKLVKAWTQANCL